MSSESGCARLGSEVAPPLGVVKEVAVLIVFVRRHRRAVGAAVHRAVDDEAPGAVEEETGPAAVRCVSPSPLDALPVHALGALGIVVVVRDAGPRQVVCDDVTDAACSPSDERDRKTHLLSGKALLQRPGDATSGYDFLIEKFVGPSISLSGRGLSRNGPEDQQAPCSVNAFL